MSAIKKFIMEDVRCFKGRNEFEIRPLTIVMGENSTGKSTMLGCYQVLNDYISGRKEVDFNEPPYSMGTFHDIVRRSSPIGEKFNLAATYKHSDMSQGITESQGWLRSNSIEVGFGIKEQGAEPVIDQITITGEIGRAEQKIVIEQGEKHYFGVVEAKDSPKSGTIRAEGDLSRYPNTMFFSSSFSGVAERPQRDLSQIRDRAILRIFDRPAFSFAPIRSKPERTYQPLKLYFDPAGSRVPVLLMELAFREGTEWQNMQNHLVEFGKASGLFTDIEVKRYGKAISNPFALQFVVRGRKANIIDVGYGISQVLPLLVEIFSKKESTQFLMQQPEVHLHPSAQAELASLFINLIKNRQHSFIVETHSDYIIDRTRIEIRRGNISPEDVSLIYLKPNSRDATVKVHNIGFDELGNLKKTPRGYRDFFLKETTDLLGFNSD